MAHAVLVHVVDGAHNLLHQDGGLNFSEMAGLDDAVKKLAAAAQL
eukprot:CAMPEP_0179087356 /NCGR_PEP_ID=MMETSP0796-20121207/39685_1 /TAXON_ID=73915 /ORGANISM="Pyrodinium bahamense, Strain pbaha01" /LENGTH=44 /DNA_ID= /DNA_START= /DNA_END= /DNA_ORIENTATION=